ncbi:uncharacterized protein LOC108206851 [Daucus carota subsp. sativus]|uniref:uncharacterized protein LOC108206851 n=1 Tax=Daucus carota subsp. sativus TaxID=79200 RepID=UPI0007EFF6C2|nr:PREDICTED: uncharacterized protein LOC108206851 isoform X1 [Daucus carota subsp. sativus]
MSSTLEHFSHPKHPLILFDTFLKEYFIFEKNAACVNCQLPVEETPAYTCRSHDRTFYVHKSCVTEQVLRCYGCSKTVIGLPTYICHDNHNIDCRNFFLHKTCATLPNQINHKSHTQHPLTLVPRRDCVCKVCRRTWKLFTYACMVCDFDVCVFCAFEQKQRALGHEGHKKHRPAMLLLEQHKVRQEHFSHPNHPLILIADEIMVDDATCYICNTPVRGTCTYICPINDIDCRNFYLHMSCAELPREIYFQNHKQHCAFLKPCSDCVCDFCGVDVNFGYACGVCSSFIVCVFCASEEIERTKLLTWTPPAPILRARDYSYRPPPKVEHFSHPKHTLRLVRESDDVGEDEICHLCNKPVIGSPTYTCSKDAIDCERFYLHKTCADLPMELNHSLDRHLLGLMPRPDGHLCAVCASKVKYAYACDNCNTNVCVFCGFEQRVIYHEGHHEHNLTLQREAEFKCDACSVKAQDYSYVCTPCDFWIHKTCAFAPSTIPAPAYHHHPLSLIYSIPEMHRYFSRNCAVCSKLVERHHWLYYCHKCTFFVHIKCSTSKYPLGLQGLSVWFANDIGEPNLVQFPLSSKESLFGLIVDQCRKLQIDFQGEGENSFTATTTDGPHIIEEHWSHPQHQLKQLHFTENDDDDMDSDTTRVLICDGCIQPITAHHPCYYSCVRCEFLLHSFCATKLPRVFPSEAFPSHPNHSLVLQTVELAYIFVKCGACNSATNGFYYHCETCDMTIDIRCAFLPSRIKHESHKHHSLVQCPPSNFICSASKLRVIDRVGYACKSCPFFRVDILCAFYPSSIKHRYDDSRDITLRHPPFFHEGVIYCEICEEQVNNQWWLYHCSESAHSYHHNCLQWHENVKLRSSIVTGAHTLSMVFKRTKRRNSPRYICGDCNKGYKCSFLIECDGCGLLVCLTCFYNFMALCFPGWVTWAGILRRAIKP